MHGGEFLTVLLSSSVTMTPKHQQIPIPAKQSITDYNPGSWLPNYWVSLVLALSYCSSTEQCFTGFTKVDEIGINYTTSSFRMETLETVYDTCAKVTFVNFLCNCLACFRDFFPGLTGRSILGVLIFALAVIKISLKSNIPTILTQSISQNSSLKTLSIQSLKCKALLCIF